MPAPANDDFANREVITGALGSATGSNVSATLEAGEPNSGFDYATIWYEWVAPTTDTYVFDFATAFAGFDVTFYTGTSLAGLTALFEYLTGGTHQSCHVPVVSGTSYKIQVSSFGSPPPALTGDISISWGLQGLVLKLADLASNELADITPIALEKNMQRRLSQARVLTVQAPAGHSLLTTVAGDGYPNLRRGNRKLLVYEDGKIIFHGRVWTVERNGDGTQNLVTITAQMPLAELGYDPDLAGRVVRGSTTQPTAGDPFGTYDGDFIEPLFASSVAAQDAISGPDLVLQILTNSQNTGAESDPSPGEGPLPIDLTTGTFDLDCPPAIDLNPAGRMSWPMLCGDFIQQLAASGACDIDERPVDPREGLDPYVMSAISAVSAQGVDHSENVNAFEYFTGSCNVSQCQHIDDFSTINNKLYSFLGPPGPGGTRFPLGNITPGTPGTTVDPSASRTLYGGQFIEIQITDWTGLPADARPFALALWNAEQGDRVEPRGRLHITPAPNMQAKPPADFDVGDLIQVNVGADFGLTIATIQRIYGYTVTWDRQGVKRVSQLIVSASET